MTLPNLKMATKRTATDPVCGMDVDTANPAGTMDHEGKTYFFCSQRCLERFRADPKRFLGPGALRKAMDVAEGADPYVCPMDADVESGQPGACPKCGMALEPRYPIMAKTTWTCPMH